MLKIPTRWLVPFLAICSFGVLIAGCAPYSITTKTVNASDILGSWQTEYDDLSKGQCIFTFQADGTFTEVITIRGSSQARESTGKWQLDGSNLRFDGIQSFDGYKWHIGTGTYFIVDSRKRPGTLAISGSLIGDPDSYHELTRLP